MGVSIDPAKTNNPRKRALFKPKKVRKPKDKPEWKLQAAVVSDFHKCQDAGWEFEFAGDMNAGRRNGARAKLTGLKAGETDLRIYCPGGVLKMIELKTSKGVLSNEQIKRHAKLRALGFEIVTVWSGSEKCVVQQCRTLLAGWLKGRTVH